MILDLVIVGIPFVIGLIFIRIGILAMKGYKIRKEEYCNTCEAVVTGHRRGGAGSSTSFYTLYAIKDETGKEMEIRSKLSFDHRRYRKGKKIKVYYKDNRKDSYMPCEIRLGPFQIAPLFIGCVAIFVSISFLTELL